MGMTITEKILANKSDVNKVEPGELIITKLDAILANDITAAIAIPEMKKMGYDKVFDSKKVIFVMDHF
ncbi:MAG: 3-isopropylmalate dehydratase large subunit, partial [Firmicutes bacterium HGW-Firmicutes-12]